ncbi:MAG TPA: ABC transporter substrate-binding protein [Casimicrobiaceae bacterium]|nr:ABC transporter substrate-binding protein [Casimicrobiaceae bacterium]
MQDLGYVPGKNLIIVYRQARRSDALPSFAKELVQLKVDVIVTSGEAAAMAAKGATSAIPIVATELAMDPVKAGIVGSLSRPEANVTGLATQSEELWMKRLSVFKQLVPRVARIAILSNPTNPSNAACTDEINRATAALALQARSAEVPSGEAIQSTFAALAKDRPDALAICWDSVTLANAKQISDSAAHLKVPTVAPLQEYVKAGSLMSLGFNLPAHRRRAAVYVDKIIKGAKPATLPVERPLQFDLVVNLVTARALGIEPPANILLLADEVVQ